MKVRIYTRKMGLICQARIKAIHIKELWKRGAIWYTEGFPEMYWDDFSAYIEEAFA